MHGALKGFGTKPVIRDAKVKSVSAIEAEGAYLSESKGSRVFETRLCTYLVSRE
jgi:hypothetical protein